MSSTKESNDGSIAEVTIGSKNGDHDTQTHQKSDDEKHGMQNKEPKRRLWFDAKISSLTKLTPSVTGLTLQVESSHPVETKDDGKSWQNSPFPSEFRFLPGQWVDFYIPALRKIGGYSITSLPQNLPRLELAVKRSRHPPAEWVTCKAQIGDAVKVRVGGEFVYDASRHLVEGECTVPSPDRGGVGNKYLFIAGGVGINPLYSMMRQLEADVKDETNNRSLPKAALLYSASTLDELLFEPELSAMVSELPHNLRVYFNVTRAKEETPKGSTVHVAGDRITSKKIGEAIEWLSGGNESLNEDSTSVYICGPPGMAEAIADACCDDHAIPRSTIHFEQWW